MRCKRDVLFESSKSLYARRRAVRDAMGGTGCCASLDHKEDHVQRSVVSGSKLFDWLSNVATTNDGRCQRTSIHHELYVPSHFVQ